MRRFPFFAGGMLAMLASVGAQVPQNPRLKTMAWPDQPIAGSSRYRVASGFWVPESKDPRKALGFPVQVRIECHKYSASDMRCTEIGLTLLLTKDAITVEDIQTAYYDIDSWDEHGLIASYGGDETASRCQRHVLTMVFESGAVSVSDLPTHKKGCEAFSETNSYRLSRGHYYVDTTPKNDLDKAAKKP